MTLTGKLFFLLALLGAVVCQYSKPLLVGTNYQTNDHTRREVVDKNGNIQGQYSYVAPGGSTISVKYLAGKNGYKVLNDPTEQLLSRPQSDQLPISYQSQKSSKPIQQSFHRHPQPEIQEQDYQEQYHQNDFPEALPQQVYQEPLAQQVYQKPLLQQTYQQPLRQQSFQSYQNPQFDLQGFQKAFQNTQNYQQPSYQPKYTQIPQNLFSPAEQPFPAYTAGQVKSMRNFLEEEMAELEKMKRESDSSSKNEQKSGQSGRAYVSVKNTNQGYSYDINL